jgi:2-amino-4-hydroxy-6-hydroxymethyldihydropteridine diphosphokinase
MRKLCVGLGSNQGNRAENLAVARRALLERGLVAKLIVSPIYEAQALLPEDAPPEWDVPFFNQVLVGETAIDPESWLKQAQNIEILMGREKHGIWCPRVIDIDLLDYEGFVADSAFLTVPHRHCLARDFVLVPWRDIAPDWQLRGATVEAHCHRLGYGEHTGLIRLGGETA